MPGIVAIGAFLMTVAWPIVKNVLLSMGIGWLTYEGLSMIGDQVVSQVSLLWGQVPADMFNMASLLGMPQSIGIILGGVNGRIALASVARLGKVTA